MLLYSIGKLWNYCVTLPLQSFFIRLFSSDQLYRELPTVIFPLWTLKLSVRSIPVLILNLNIWIDTVRGQCGISGPISSFAERWIGCRNIIFWTILGKALTLASSCNWASCFLSKGHHRYKHTHSKCLFCLYRLTNIDSLLFGRVTTKCSFGDFGTIVLLTFHTLFVSRCYG